MRSHPAASLFKMMVVIKPQTLGYPPLPCTNDELRKIEEHVPMQPLVRLGVPDALASVETVFFHLYTVSMVHLVCHSQQIPDRPLESSFILADGQKLKLAKIMEPMPNALLAFLSACRAQGHRHILQHHVPSCYTGRCRCRL